MKLRIKYELEGKEYISTLNLNHSISNLELLQKVLHFEIIEYIER